MNNKFLFYPLVLISLFYGSIFGYGQAQLRIEGGYLVQNDSSEIALQNAEFVNNGTYEGTWSVVVTLGDGSDDQSAISGDSLSTFYDLESANGTNVNEPEDSRITGINGGDISMISN